MTSMSITKILHTFDKIVSPWIPVSERIAGLVLDLFKEEIIESLFSYAVDSYNKGRQETLVDLAKKVKFLKAACRYRNIQDIAETAKHSEDAMIAFFATQLLTFVEKQHYQGIKHICDQVIKGTCKPSIEH